MSRVASKSSGEKNNGLPSSQVTPPPMQDLNYIVPGRLTRAQWMDMLIYEEADEIVGEITDELLSRVMEGCLKIYVEAQIVPFSVSWAKSYITQILEQQILCPDVGDEPEEASKTEDIEPLPAIPDSWAQECVPVVTTTSLQQEAGSGFISAQKESVVDQQCGAVARTDSSPRQSEKETRARGSATDQYCKGLSPRPPPKPVKKKKQRVNVIHKPVPGQLLPSLSTSVEKKDVDLEKKRMANIFKPKPIPKIDPASLPRHYVIPQYEIVDYNGPKLKKPYGLSKLQPKYNKQQTEWTAGSLKPVSHTKDQLAGFQKRHETDMFMKKLSPTQRKEGTASSGSLRLDKMVLAKGVTLLDPKAVEMNPLVYNSVGLPTNLRPIRSDVAVPLISADQITAGPPPKIIPLFESRY